MAAPATFGHGPFLGPFTLLAPISTVGRCEIYRARDTRVDRLVFIKSIIAESGRLDALLRNASAAASFLHPNVLRLLEIGQDDSGEWLFAVSECVPGHSLRSLMVGRRYSARRSIGLAIQLAETIADAHAADLVHGDLTPDDIIVTPRGNGRILHLGLTARGAGNRLPPADGYASPERILGDAIDHPADVFSLGAILFEMLMGRPPAVGSTAADAAEQIRADLYLPIGFGPRVSAELRRTITGALEADVTVRCGSAAAFAAELRAIAAILGLRGGGGR